MSRKQDYLRKQVKLAKAMDDEWNFKNMSEVLQISPNSFYNWLSGAYELSSAKERELDSLLSDLLE